MPWYNDIHALPQLYSCKNNGMNGLVCIETCFEVQTTGTISHICRAASPRIHLFSSWTNQSGGQHGANATDRFDESKTGQAGWSSHSWRWRKSGLQGSVRRVHLGQREFQTVSLFVCLFLPPSLTYPKLVWQNQVTVTITSKMIS